MSVWSDDRRRYGRECHCFVRDGLCILVDWEERALVLDRVGCMDTGMYGVKEFVMDFVFAC